MSESMVGFRQAVIPVEKEAEFGKLKSAIDWAFGAGRVEDLLKLLNRENVRVRDFGTVLDRGLIERIDADFRKSGASAKALYEALTVSDQGQMREFYLSKIEQVEASLRHKFRKIYQYY